MSDSSLREAERRALIGDTRDRVAYLQQQVRISQPMQSIRTLPNKECTSSYHIVNWGMGEPPCGTCGDYFPIAVGHENHIVKCPVDAARDVVTVQAYLGHVAAREVIPGHFMPCAAHIRGSMDGTKRCWGCRYVNENQSEVIAT